MVRAMLAMVFLGMITLSQPMKAQVMNELRTAVGCRWDVSERDGKPLLWGHRGEGAGRAYATEVKVEPLGNELYKLVALVKEEEGGEVLAGPSIRMRSGETSEAESTLPDGKITVSARIDPSGTSARYSITVSRNGAVEFRHSASVAFSGVAVSSAPGWVTGVCARRGGEVRRLDSNKRVVFFSTDGSIEVFPCGRVPQGMVLKDGK